MDYTINIPDELIPGIIATAYAEGKSPEAVVGEYAVAVATKACQDLFVGPYYRGPIPPKFNADGTPYADVEVPPVDVPVENVEVPPVENVITEI